MCHIYARAHLSKLDGKGGDEERVEVVRQWFVLRRFCPKISENRTLLYEGKISVGKGARALAPRAQLIDQ